MRQTPTTETGRPRFFRPRVTALIGVGLAVALSAGCRPKPKGLGQPWLYVANTAGAVIQIFGVQVGGPNNLPQLIQQPGGGVPVTSGAPLAIHVVGSTLYAATGSGAVAQYTIDRFTGNLSLRGTISAGSPPYAIAATTTTLYVANRGSSNVSVFSIDASGNLASLQTASVDAVNAIQIDGSGKFLFTGSRANGATGPKVCTHTIQSDGTLPAGPGNCVAVSGAPEAMPYSGGVLYLLFNAPASTGFGNSNWVSAWTVGTTGNLSQRGQGLDVGAANAAGLASSVDGKFLFLPRQGGFLTISAADPLQVVASATPITGSQWCVWPPAAAGGALVDPRGKVLYVSDPVGAAVGNIQGARISSLTIDGGGALSPILCDAVGGKPISMAIFLP